MLCNSLLQVDLTDCKTEYCTGGPQITHTYIWSRGLTDIFWPATLEIEGLCHDIHFEGIYNSKPR